MCESSRPLIPPMSNESSLPSFDSQSSMSHPSRLGLLMPSISLGSQDFHPKATQVFSTHLCVTNTSLFISTMCSLVRRLVTRAKIASDQVRLTSELQLVV